MTVKSFFIYNLKNVLVNSSKNILINCTSSPHHVYSIWWEMLRRAYRYQSGYQKPWIEGGQTIQRQKRTNNDLRKNTHKTKDRATRSTLKTGSEYRCSGRISSYCSTSDNRCVTLVTNPNDKLWVRKWPESVYDKWSIFVVKCDTDIP